MHVICSCTYNQCMYEQHVCHLGGSNVFTQRHVLAESSKSESLK